MLGPIHQARHDVCVACPYWDPDAGRCTEVDENPIPYGADANKTAIAPWKFRRECEEWDEKIPSKEGDMQDAAVQP